VRLQKCLVPALVLVLLSTQEEHVLERVESPGSSAGSCWWPMATVMAAAALSALASDMSMTRRPLGRTRWRYWRSSDTLLREENAESDGTTQPFGPVNFISWLSLVVIVPPMVTIELLLRGRKKLLWRFPTIIRRDKIIETNI